MDPADGRSQSAKAIAMTQAQQHPLLRSSRKDIEPGHSTLVRWRVIYVIFFSLVGGLAFALGHHFMNKSVHQWLKRDCKHLVGIHFVLALVAR